MKKIKKAKEEFKEGKNGIGFVSSFFLSEYGNDEITKGSVFKLHTLKKSMKDSEIIKEFGIQECSLGDIIATLKTAPAEMKDGNWNLFYVAGHPSHVVNVGWSSDCGEWSVRVWYRGDFTWSADLRVFSPATSDSKTLSPLSLDSLPLILNINGIEYKRND